MSLPVIIKFVYNHANEESIRRGKKIFYSAGVQLLDSDQVIEQIRFRVRNDQFQNYYAVTVNNFLSPEELTVTCQCPYNMGEVCRHKVAALFQLNDIIQSGFFDNAELSYNQQHTIVRMKQVSKQVLQIFSSVETIEHAERWAAEKRAVIKPIKHEKIEADIEDGSTTFHVIISQNEERYFDTSCGCSETHFPLCIHKATVFLQILKKHGADYFQSLQNWDIQKNKLLALYGYSLKDNLKGKFAFTYENGKPFLRVLDPTIKKVSQAATASSMAATTTTVATETPAPEAMPEKLAAELHLAILIKINENRLPFVTFNPATAYYDLADPTQLLRIEPIDTTQYINPQRYKDTERDILPMLKKVEHGEVVKYIQKNSPFTQVEGADAPPHRSATSPA